MLGLTWTFIVVGIVVLASMVWLGFVGPEARGAELDEDEDGHAAAATSGPALPGGAAAASHS